jgi:tRNA (cmo5U34)-methyltransferase
MSKSSVEEIRRRFDKDVERFSNLETGQSATMDSPLCLELIATAAKAATPNAKALLDVGCGAGNYTIRLLRELPGLDCTLLDLSRPMLDRAQLRVSAATIGRVQTVQEDIRAAKLPEQSFDVIVAASVLHHLRTDDEWQAVFDRFFKVLRPGGSVWIFDYIDQQPAIRPMMQRRYGEYLTGLKDQAYRDHVFAYIEKEDTPRPLVYQLNLLQEAGFVQVDVLHKNGPFAAFGGIRPGDAQNPTGLQLFDD